MNETKNTQTMKLKDLKAGTSIYYNDMANINFEFVVLSGRTEFAVDVRNVETGNDDTMRANMEINPNANNHLHSSKWTVNPR